MRTTVFDIFQPLLLALFTIMYFHICDLVYISPAVCLHSYMYLIKQLHSHTLPVFVIKCSCSAQCAYTFTKSLKKGNACIWWLFRFTPMLDRQVANKSWIDLEFGQLRTYFTFSVNYRNVGTWMIWLFLAILAIFGHYCRPLTW